MDASGNVFIAFEDRDEEAIRSFLNGAGDARSQAQHVRYQGRIRLTREDYEGMDLLLQALHQALPGVASMRTVAFGTDEFSAFGTGIQYRFAPDAVRAMADAYDRVTPAMFDAAMLAAFEDFDPAHDADMKQALLDAFATLRRDLRMVADNGWTLVTGWR